MVSEQTTLDGGPARPTESWTIPSTWSPILCPRATQRAHRLCARRPNGWINGNGAIFSGSHVYSRDLGQDDTNRVVHSMLATIPTVLNDTFTLGLVLRSLLMTRREARALRQAREGDVIFEGPRTSVLRRRPKTVALETSVPRRVSSSPARTGAHRWNQGRWVVKMRGHTTSRGAHCLCDLCFVFFTFLRSVLQQCQTFQSTRLFLVETTQIMSLRWVFQVEIDDPGPEQTFGLTRAWAQNAREEPQDTPALWHLASLSSSLPASRTFSLSLSGIAVGVTFTPPPPTVRSALHLPSHPNPRQQCRHQPLHPLKAPYCISKKDCRIWWQPGHVGVRGNKECPQLEGRSVGRGVEEAPIAPGTHVGRPPDMPDSVGEPKRLSAIL